MNVPVVLSYLITAHNIILLVNVKPVAVTDSDAH